MQGGHAVKAVPMTSQLLEEVQHEANVYSQLVSLQGSTIPQIHFAGELDLFGEPYYGLIMDVCGVALASLLPAELSKHKGAALDCLQQLHRCGFIHGDVRLANFLVSNTDRVVLIDLAFAERTACNQQKGKEKESLISLFDIA
jgi:serine/threonine protein kinase